ncbi:DUF4878 domain-containing protein [Spirabiliibacterium falconis]|uniref:DUF4878 domain-containing protein n=1 Tax=Spirabiliibacterium falconis TaxID=572023 RepID=UPI001AAD5FA8|nr:DUF4878 domain-containing protein [Spirabiliibacterium falconis]MBE2895205.1 DUF4878 domain-containing protein [Spirabiliibacterium falconis]
MKKLFALVLALFTLVACGGADNNSPESAAASYVQAIYQGDIDAAMKLIYISEKDKQQAGINDLIKGKLAETAQENQENAKQKGGLKTVHAENAVFDEQDKNQASVSVKVEFKKAEPILRQIRVIKTDDGWKVKL